ncbi:MAG: DUF6597 domain-containing transcriptional factor, partial [Thermonemataceae bacterium]
MAPILYISPPSPLKKIVKHFWYVAVSNPDKQVFTYSILADGAPGIIFQHYRGRSAVAQADGTLLPVAFIYGQNSSACLNYLTGAPAVFGVSLQPAALKCLFSMDAHLAYSTVLDATHFFSSAWLEQLFHTARLGELVQLFSTKLVQQLADNTLDQMITQSTQWMTQNPTPLDSKILASHFNISRRQFQRRFKAQIGVCPEQYTHITRFQRAIHWLLSGRYKKLSDISYALNYADQSHFNRA